MWKSGICTCNDLDRIGSPSSDNRELLRRSYYIGLYDDVVKSDHPDSAKWQEAILASFAVANNALKRTGRGGVGQLVEKQLA
jgi:hypothetical protein